MGSKIRRMIDRASELLELAVNIIIIIAVIVAVISLWKPFMEFVSFSRCFANRMWIPFWKL